MTEALEELEEKASSNGSNPHHLFEYNPRDKDHAAIIAQWYGELEVNGEMETLFGPSTRSLSDIMLRFNAAQVGIAVDEHGVYFVGWFEPWLNSAWFGMWVRHDKRRLPSTFKLMVLLLNEAFKKVPIVTGITCREDILSAHRKLGYSISMALPDLYGVGKPGWLVQLHKHDFKYLEEE